MALGSGAPSRGSLNNTFVEDSIPALPSRFEINEHTIVVRCGEAHSILAQI